MDNLPTTIRANVLIEFSQDQVDLIKSMVAQDATDNELKLFLYQCQRTGLDPLAKQIYCVYRWASVQDTKTGKWKDVRRMTIQTAIDGFRLIADRSGKYAGQLGPEWCGQVGGWTDVWRSSTGEQPVAARVGVLRNDFKEPLWSVAHWDSYVQKNNQGQPTRAWKTMGPVMIAKCAEALALRRAFPQELSGLTTPDELPEDEAPPPAPVARPDAMRPAGPQIDPDQVTGGPLPQADQSHLNVIPGEVVESENPAPPSPTPAAPPRPAANKLTITEIAALEKEARLAAEHGSAAFQAFWRRVQGHAQSRNVINGLRQELLKTMDEADRKIAEAGKEPDEFRQIGEVP